MTYTLHTSGVLLFGLLLLGFMLDSLGDFLTAETGLERLWNASVCLSAAWGLVDLIAAVTR